MWKRPWGFRRASGYRCAWVLAWLVLDLTNAVRGATVTVDIVDFAYSPASVTINAGDSVTWRQRDFIQHTTTSDAGVWNSPYLSVGQTFSFTFNSAGMFTYYCEPHTYMTGTVIVRASVTPIAPIKIESIEDRGIALTLRWSGGKPPYLVQKKAALADSSWFNLLTTDQSPVTVAKDSPASFFRIQDQASITVAPFTALLNGDGESPPVQTSASGVGTLALEGDRLSYLVSYAELSGAASAAHVHGPADALHNAPPIITFSGPFGSSGTVNGSATLTAAQLAALKSGQMYVNFHTAANGGGEIRGQIVPLQSRVSLTGAAEVPPVNTTAKGTAVLTLIGTRILIDINYENLSSAPTSAHLHGPSAASAAAPPIIPLPKPVGTSGSLSGTATLTPEQLVFVLTGQTYLNIHTANNGGGEIRGHVSP